MKIIKSLILFYCILSSTLACASKDNIDSLHQNKEVRKLIAEAALDTLLSLRTMTKFAPTYQERPNVESCTVARKLLNDKERLRDDFSNYLFERAQVIYNECTAYDKYELILSNIKSMYSKTNTDYYINLSYKNFSVSQHSVILDTPTASTSNGKTIKLTECKIMANALLNSELQPNFRSGKLSCEIDGQKIQTPLSISNNLSLNKGFHCVQWDRNNYILTNWIPNAFYNCSKYKLDKNMLIYFALA